MSSTGRKTKTKQKSSQIQINEDLNRIKDLGSLSYPSVNDIPDELILMCEDMSKSENMKMFIFSSSEKILISTDKRNSKIDNIFDTSFYIDNESGFDLLPSRFAFYDTVTKSSDRNKRWNLILDKIKSLGFDYTFKDFLDYDDLPKNIEVSFCNCYDSRFILRLSPNFMINISFSEGSSWKFFYDYDKIIDILSLDSNIQFRREILISNLVEK